MPRISIEFDVPQILLDNGSADVIAETMDGGPPEGVSTVDHIRSFYHALLVRDMRERGRSRLGEIAGNQWVERVFEAAIAKSTK